MATALRIEVESTGVNAPPVDNTSVPKTFNQMKEEREAAANKFREDAAKMRKETGMGGTVTPAQERKRLADEERQNRDENWLAKQEAREQRKAAALAARAEARQERDENWLAAQEKRAKKAAEAQQKRDEDWYERDERKKRSEEAQRKQREWWNNPANIAQNMVQRQQFMAQTRGQYSAQRLGGMLGMSPNSPLVQGAGRLASGFNLLTMRFQPLIAVASALYGAWNAAKDNLLEEAQRVKNFSPALRLQEVRQNLRNLQTDMEIARKYGDRMAQVQELDSRQADAQRRLGIKVSTAINEFFAPITDRLQEGYTNLLEWLASDSNEVAKSNDYLMKLTGMSEQQLGILMSRRDQDFMEQVSKGADSVLKVIGGNGLFNQSDEITDALGEKTSHLLGFDVWKINGQNPGFVPVPSFWKDAESR